MKQIKLRKKLRSFLFYVSLVAILVILLFPIYWMIVTSFLQRDALLSSPPPLLPKMRDLQLKTYLNVVNQRPLLRWLYNSFVVALFSSVFSLVVSVFAGYSISRFPTRFNHSMGYFLLVARMLPSTLLVIPLYIIFSRLGLIDNFLSLIIGNIAFITPFATWMLKAFFDSIPVSLEEAAQIDGCTHLQALWKIVFPLCLPGVAATEIYAAILSWSEFLFAKTFMTGQESWTVTVGIASLRGEHVVLWDELMATTFISIVPIIVVFIFLEKYLISSMTAGAVKQ